MLAGLTKLTALKSPRLAALLKGVAGFTGGGVVRYTRRPDGRGKIEADLSGVAGLKVEVVVKAAPVGVLACRDGVVAGRLETAQGAPIPALEPGDLIEIRQNGAAILRGAFAPAQARSLSR